VGKYVVRVGVEGSFARSRYPRVSTSAGIRRGTRVIQEDKVDALVCYVTVSKPSDRECKLSMPST